MLKNSWRIGLAALALLLFAVPEGTAQGGGGGGFQNLQVFNPDISKDELKGVMKGFTQQLGVKCVYCHVPDEYHKDDKEHKLVARAMITMVKHLNENAERFFPGERNKKLRCWTCHRGVAEVEEFVPEEEE